MKQLLTILSVLILTSNIWAQAPEKMGYQAVIRDASGALLVNQTIGMQISILKTTTSGTAVYVETQTPTSNENGLVTLEIGTGTVISGDFSDIDWVDDSYFIKTETDPSGGTSYTIAGTSQLMSVPYALHAKTADSIVNSKPVFRWASWSNYNQIGFWYANNSANMFGGINPSTWSDGNAIASDMSSDKQVLLTLFSKKIYPGKNAVVFANEWYSYSSTNGQFAGAILRIENTTESAIIWSADWYSTAYGGWGERSSVALNGVNVWNSGSAAYGVNHHESTSITIPANRVSTIIFIAGSSNQNNTRGTFLAFDNDCLSLPTGLQLVDDLDTAANGWGF